MSTPVILLPVDGSDHATRAAAYASKIAGMMNARVQLLYCHRPFPIKLGEPYFQKAVDKIAAGANTLLEPGDNVVRFRPTYEQLSGNASNLGIEVRTVDLVEDRGWALDADALDASVDERTKIIHVVNPNNPTGGVLSGAVRVTQARDRVRRRSGGPADSARRTYDHLMEAIDHMTEDVQARNRSNIRID